MSDNSLPQRAVAVSVLALLLGGASLAPAAADPGNGKDGKKGKDGKEGTASTARGGQRGPRVARTGAPQDPAGNNGTTKVDGFTFDDGLGNEPHVTCGFRLELYGFDEGQTGDITIAGQAPSGSGVVSERTGVLLSDDAAGGGPHDADAVVEYTMDDLDLTGLTPHPEQGYHVKVTLSTGTPGGVKHKVFWIESCAPETSPVAPPVAPPVGGTDTETGDAVQAPVVGSETAGTDARVLGTKLTRDRDASVLGNVLTRAPLAFTGSFADLLLALGAGLVAAGGALLARARRHPA